MLNTTISFGDYTVTVQKTLNSQEDKHIILYKGEPFLYLHNLDDCKDVANILSVYQNKIDKLKEDLATRSNQVAFAEHLIEDLGGYEMRRQWSEFNED